MSSHLDALERVITDAVAPAATSVDEQGAFPLPALTAPGQAGIPGPTIGADAGGGSLDDTLTATRTGVERHFRASPAAAGATPTTDALIDFVRRAVPGLPLFGSVR